MEALETTGDWEWRASVQDGQLPWNTGADLTALWFPIARSSLPHTPAPPISLTMTNVLGADCPLPHLLEIQRCGAVQHTTILVDVLYLGNHFFEEQARGSRKTSEDGIFANGFSFSFRRKSSSLLMLLS